MTMLEYLQGLRYADGTSVVVSRGVLSTEQEAEAEGVQKPYLLLFNPADAPSGQFHSGGQEITTILQIVLEQRPSVPGQVPDITEIERLYGLVGDAPAHVGELMSGVPFIYPLRYVGGLGRPEQRHKTPDWLAAGIEFEGKVQTNY